MAGEKKGDFTDGSAYEKFMGRWSRMVAPLFLDWLKPEQGLRWLDVGCGPGPLSEAILTQCAPASLLGLDLSEAQVSTAQQKLRGAVAEFRVADAQQLPLPDGEHDLAVSGLVLNFLPDPTQAVAEMRRVVCPGGTVAEYVWDYTPGKMTSLFWEHAAFLDPGNDALDIGKRFPMCQPDPLTSLFRSAGLEQTEVRNMHFEAVFEDFEDYWTPFEGGQAPSGVYLKGLSEERRSELRERLQAALPAGPDGRITLPASAWAVRGIVPTG